MTGTEAPDKVCVLIMKRGERCSGVLLDICPEQNPERARRGVSGGTEQRWLMVQGYLRGGQISVGVLH